MSGTLVIHICERCGHKKECITAYIFYDYKRRIYGLRFGSIDTMTDNKNDCVMKSYSYYCGNDSALLNFLNNLISMENVAEIALINYDDLPIDSDKITYELLVENDDFDNEIIGCEYRLEEESENPYKKMMEMLDIIKNVYNEY